MRPTREGGVTPRRPGLLRLGYGVSPDVVVEDPEPPTDRLDENALAYVPVLDPPSLGSATDLNLQFGTDSDGGGIRPVTNPTYANDGNLSTSAGRASYYNGSGTDTWYLRADLGSAMQVDEIVIRGGKGNSGENQPIGNWAPQFSDDNSSWTNVTGSQTNSATNPRTTTWALTGSPTHRYWRIREDVPSGFTYPLKVHTWQLNGPQTVDPTEVRWQEAGETIDGSDTTFGYANSDSVAAADNLIWRATLADSYLISSLRALIGFETAGSVTVTLYGAQLEDYSDAVALATDTLTATGSLTGDEVAMSWSPDAVYRYWQLELDAADGVRIFEVELYDPPTFTGAHEDLTGRDAADQHPADAVTVTPFASIAASNVQDALEEIVAEAGSTLTVDDGTTSVSPVDTIVFDGATVTDDTGGQVTVAVSSTPNGTAGVRHTFTLGPFVLNDVPGTATTQLLLQYMNTSTAVSQGGSTNSEPLMQAAGRVVGAILAADDARTAGTATLRVRVAGTGAAFNGGAVALDGTNTTRDSSFVSYANGVAFTAGQSIGAEVVTSSFTPTTANLLAWLIVSLDDVLQPLNNYSATSNPTSGDDAADGYSVGSRWINTTTGSLWTCIVATTGAAIWHAQVNPMPDLSGHAGQFSASTTSLAITTSAFAVGSNLVFFVCSTTRKPNAAPTQTNVTWTERYASSGNSEFLTVYTGVVAGGAAGTTLTTTFASGTAVWAEVMKFDDSVIANFTAATAATTGTVASTALNTLAVGGMTIGGIYAVGWVAAAPASSYGGCNHGHMPGFTSFGGQGRVIVFRAQQDSMYAWNLCSSAVNQFAALVRLT